MLQIFELLGLPTEASWPGYKRLPNARSLRLPSDPRMHGSILSGRFPYLTSAGTTLLSSLLALNPASRPTAAEILVHPYFREDPKPKSTTMFPTFPSKAGQEKRRRVASPSAPKRGEAPRIGEGAIDFGGIFAGREEEEKGGGFALKLI